MMNTKDVAGYMAPLRPHAASLTGVTIPGEANTLSAEATATAARAAGIPSKTAASTAAAVAAIAGSAPEARILICGSLYLAGTVLPTHQ